MSDLDNKVETENAENPTDNGRKDPPWANLKVTREPSPFLTGVLFGVIAILVLVVLAMGFGGILAITMFAEFLFAKFGFVIAAIYVVSQACLLALGFELIAKKIGEETEKESSK